jgi:hypothetical protein
MRRGVSVLALTLLLAGAGALAAEQSPWLESLSELENHFSEHGLEPLPGQGSMRVDGGVVGVFPGEVVEGGDKPYVLITASPPAQMNSVAVLVSNARNGLNYNGLPLPAFLESPGRHVIVAYWEDPRETGEKIVPLEKVAAYLDLSDFDGYKAHHVRVLATGSSPVWPRLIEQSNIPLGIDLQLEDAPDLGSERARTFYGKRIPGLQVANSESGSSGSGRAPAYVPVTTLAAMIAAKVSRLDEPPPFQRVDRSAESQKPKAKLPSTGTIPDYTADVEGLLLEGVVEGGAAEKAGLQAGDVIVELAGSAITDVYTYADVLDTLEIDTPITVVFLRNDERQETTLTPQSR